MSALERDFGLTPSLVSTRLGYANASTVTQIRQGKVVPDPVRLATFAAGLAEEHGRTVNLHWVLTGSGSAVVDCTHQDDEGQFDINKVIAHLSAAQRGALVTLLGSGTVKAGAKRRPPREPETERSGEPV